MQSPNLLEVADFSIHFEICVPIKGYDLSVHNGTHGVA